MRYFLKCSGYNRLLYYSQDYLADRLGYSREEICRSSTRLHDLGLVEKTNRGVKRTCIYRHTDILKALCNFQPFIVLFKVAVFFSLRLLIPNSPLNQPINKNLTQVLRNYSPQENNNFLINDLTNITPSKKEKCQYGCDAIGISTAGDRKRREEPLVKSSPTRLMEAKEARARSIEGEIVYNDDVERIDGKPRLSQAEKNRLREEKQRNERQTQREAESESRTVYGKQKKFKSAEARKNYIEQIHQQERAIKYNNAQLDPIKEIAKLRVMANKPDSPLALMNGIEFAQNFYNKLANTKERDLIKYLEASQNQ